MIGATPAGFPYASIAEIEQWIGLSEEGRQDYPAWLSRLRPEPGSMTTRLGSYLIRGEWK